MSPGYDRPDQQEFRRAIGFNCLFCHNAYPSDVYGEEPVFAGELPQGIDCQRCHGPGSRHVEAASSGKAAAETIRRAIVDPAHLSRELQLDVCMQLPLGVNQWAAAECIARYGRGPFSYRPGEPLGESFLYFDHAPGSGREDKFEIAHAAYRLRKSQRFAQSAMTCTTCHNPHDIPRGAAAEKYYEAACRTCHAAPHEPAGCINCHMTKRRAEDAVHVVMTDHYIQRRKPRKDLLASLAEPAGETATYRGAVVPYYPTSAVDELYLSLAQVRDASNLAGGILGLRRAIETRKPPEADFYFELGKAYRKAGNLVEAVSWCEEALRRRPGFRAAEKELAAALIATGDLARAASVLEKIPSDAVAITNLGNVYLRQGNLDRAAVALRQALTLDADSPDANHLIATVYAKLGDSAGAERSYRKAIAANPGFAKAHRNLASSRRAI